MSVLGWILLSISIIGCLWQWRLNIRYLVKDEGGWDNTTDGILLGCIAFGLLASFIWPLTLLFYSTRLIYRNALQLDGRHFIQLLVEGEDRITRKQRKLGKRNA